MGAGKGAVVVTPYMTMTAPGQAVWNMLQMVYTTNDAQLGSVQFLSDSF